MDRNLVNAVAWNASNITSEGPLTVLQKLDEATQDWHYISLKEYVYNDDSETIRYSNLKTTMRARMLSLTDKNNLISEGKEWSFLRSNIVSDYDGYWLSTTCGDKCGTDMLKGGTAGTGITVNYILGVRPVITITKK